MLLMPVININDPVEQGFLISQADIHVAAQEMLCFFVGRKICY